jgi:hypothetical protein
MRSLVFAALAALAVAGFNLSAQETRSGKVSTPINGKDLTGWKVKGDAKKHKWSIGIAEMDPAKKNQLVIKDATDGKGELVNGNGGGGVDIATEEKFGDCLLEIELMVPQGSNSGIYMMGEYEVQILDSFGRAKVGPGDIGGLYNAAAPKLNAAKKPGEWQKFVIDFQAPKFEGGKKTSNAKFLKVTLNDQVIHENVEMKGPTPGGLTGKEAPTGPIMFQGDHGPVAFRNMKVTAK